MKVLVVDCCGRVRMSRVAVRGNRSVTLSRDGDGAEERGAARRGVEAASGGGGRAGRRRSSRSPAPIRRSGKTVAAARARDEPGSPLSRALSVVPWPCHIESRTRHTTWRRVIITLYTARQRAGRGRGCTSVHTRACDCDWRGERWQWCRADKVKPKGGEHDPWYATRRMKKEGRRDRQRQGQGQSP